MLHGGEFDIRQLMGEEDCVGLVPISVNGSCEATIRHISAPDKESRSVSITLEMDRVYMMSGKCSVILPDQTSFKCAVFGVWRESI